MGTLRHWWRHIQGWDRLTSSCNSQTRGQSRNRQRATHEHSLPETLTRTHLSVRRRFAPVYTLQFCRPFTLFLPPPPPERQKLWVNGWDTCPGRRELLALGSDTSKTLPPILLPQQTPLGQGPENAPSTRRTWLLKTTSTRSPSNSQRLMCSHSLQV